MTTNYIIKFKPDTQYALYFWEHPEKNIQFNSLRGVIDHLEKMADNSGIVRIDKGDYHIFDREGNAYVLQDEYFIDGDNDDILLPSASPEGLTIES